MPQPNEYEHDKWTVYGGRAGGDCLPRIVRLPKWAQRHIAELEERVQRAEQTIPWTEPGMEWYTLFRPDPQNRKAMERKTFMLFTCSEGGTHPVCDIGPRDFVFVGRGKPNDRVVAPAVGSSNSNWDVIAGCHSRLVRIG